jgi:sugar phosphate isomerase/epimerase
MQKKLKIGCGEWGYRELPMEEHFRLCGKLGFKTMEFGMGGGQTGRLPARMDEKEVTDFLKMRDRHSIMTPFCCIENDFTLPDPAAHLRMVEEVLAQMRLARRLEATHVRLFAGFTPVTRMDEAIWQRLMAAISNCANLGTKLGLQIALETHGRITTRNGAALHEHTVTTDREALRRLAAALPANVGFNYDPGNIKAVAPEDKRYALDLVNSRINYCHLKDWRRQGEGWIAAAPGDDDLDYASLLEKMSYSGVCLIEYEPTGDVEDGILRSLNYFRRIGIQLEFA